jgi:RNA polymerase sigma-70 factor (ECF subfamily)
VPPSAEEIERDQPFDDVRSAELGGRLVKAIEELTPEHRAVILLREVDGLSYEEISQVLDCPKGTVMSRLHYARRQLQGRLRGLR